MRFALCFRLGAEEIDRRLRMPLNFVPEGDEDPENICDRVMDRIRKRLSIGDDKKSSTCSESVAFKVGCRLPMPNRIDIIIQRMKI